MSREIKFRAWIPHDPWEVREGLSAGYEMCYDLAFEEYAPINHLLAEVEYLMQYTGLKDVHDKEIYEGDILYLIPPQKLDDKFTYKELLHQVIWTENGFYLWRWLSEDMDPVNPAGITNLFELVGNIYENPELLSL